MQLPVSYSSRWPSRLGLAAMLVLLVLAWHFYLERSAYYDLSYCVFLFIKTKALAIQNRRFVSAITQWPPLQAVRAGWPLDSVLRLYSLAFVLYYGIVFLLSTYWLRNERVGLTVPLLFCLLASRTFYWAQSELPQGLALLLLYYAGVARQTPLRLSWQNLLIGLLIPACIFCHPLIIVPFLFLWGYDWLLNRRFRDWLYYGCLVLALGTSLYRSLTIPPGSYEDQQMLLGANLKQYFPHYLQLESFGEFWGLARTSFVALPILLLALSAFYLRQRHWLATLRLLWMWGFVAAYVFIVAVSRPQYTEATYRENMYLPLSLFVAIPFALELLPALERYRRAPWLATTTLALLLATRLFVVWYRHEPYTAYSHWLRQVMAYGRQFPERRFLLDQRNADPLRQRAGWPWWASACETLLLSARHSPDSAQTVFITDDVEPLRVAGATPGLFLGTFESMPSRELSSRYFRLPEHTAYRLLNTPPPADTAALRPYIAARAGTQLTLLPLSQRLRHGRQRPVTVRISVPLPAQPLHSGIRVNYPTILRTRFLASDDWPTDGGIVEAPLEVDVWQPWQQTIPVQCPSKPGSYLLEVSLSSQGYRDWPVRVRLPVEVD